MKNLIKYFIALCIAIIAGLPLYFCKKEPTNVLELQNIQVTPITMPLPAQQKIGQKIAVIKPIFAEGSEEKLNYTIQGRHAGYLKIEDQSLVLTQAITDLNELEFTIAVLRRNNRVKKNQYFDNKISVKKPIFIEKITISNDKINPYDDDFEATLNAVFAEDAGENPNQKEVQYGFQEGQRYTHLDIQGNIIKRNNLPWPKLEKIEETYTIALWAIYKEVNYFFDLKITMLLPKITDFKWEKKTQSPAFHIENLPKKTQFLLIKMQNEEHDQIVQAAATDCPKTNPSTNKAVHWQVDYKQPAINNATTKISADLQNNQPNIKIVKAYQAPASACIYTYSFEVFIFETSAPSQEKLMLHKVTHYEKYNTKKT